MGPEQMGDVVGLCGRLEMFQEVYGIPMLQIGNGR